MKNEAVIYVTSRQERGDASLFKTVDVAAVVTDAETDRVKIVRRRVAWEQIESAIAKLTQQYIVRPNSPHLYQIDGLRRLRDSIGGAA